MTGAGIAPAAATSLGLPYPGPDDPVANTATAIQALAQAVNDDLMPWVFASWAGDVSVDANSRIALNFPTLGTVLGAQFTGRWRADQGTNSGFGGLWIIDDTQPVVPGRVIAQYRGNSTGLPAGARNFGLSVLAWGNRP